MLAFEMNSLLVGNVLQYHVSFGCEFVAQGPLLADGLMLYELM